MIDQHINLYQDRFRERRIVLSAHQLIGLMLMSLALMASASYWYGDLYAATKSVHETKLQANALARTQLADARKKLETELANTGPDRELQRLLREIDIRKRMIGFVESNSLGSGEGFSDYLLQLSSDTVDDVWLDTISLAGDVIELSGSSLKAENVPVYFDQFKTKELFSGRVFDVFELKRNETSQWKLDFVIASRAATDD